MILTNDYPWMKEAACLGFSEIDGNFDLFFEKEREDEAKAYCAECPARTACLHYALDFRLKGGVYGGLNELERRRYGRLLASGRSS